MQTSVFTRGLIARLGLRAYPLSLTYELTWRCTLACAYCDRHTPLPNELPRSQIFAVLEEFYRLGLRHVNLDGGEPLVHPDVDAIVDWLVPRGVAVTMHTNGALVPRKLSTVRRMARVKISLDGMREVHDAMRGARSFDRAVAGASAAREAGIPVELTCTVGRHNHDRIDEVVGLAEAIGAPVVFQPALNSLFTGTPRDGSAWQVDRDAVPAAFRRVEELKRAGRGVGNAWSSLRHFRTFPQPSRPPCSAGWVQATMDPEGVLFPCGQVSRTDRSNSVVRLGVAAAFAALSRTGCAECWCARLVEGNYAWGLRLDRMVPPRRHAV